MRLIVLSQANRTEQQQEQQQGTGIAHTDQRHSGSTKRNGVSLYPPMVDVAASVQTFYGHMLLLLW